MTNEKTPPAAPASGSAASDGGKAAKKKPPARKPRKTATKKKVAKKAPGNEATTSSTAAKGTPTAASPATDAPGGESSAPATAPRATAPVASPSQPQHLLRMPMSVRWRDLDAFNHVNNSQYLGYLEEARLRWMMQLPGLGLDDDVAPVVAAAHLNYRRPIEWPAEVEIELFVERLGNTSLTIGHRIADADDRGIVYCDGHVVMVWIDRRSGQPAPLPAGVREACMADIAPA